MRYRVTKKIWVIPGLFRANLSRSGVSWTVKLGPFSRTWGHGRVTTSFNTPGPGGLTSTRRNRRG